MPICTPAARVSGEAAKTLSVWTGPAISSGAPGPNTLRRLLREEVLRGFKARGRWLVSVASLREYSHPFSGWLLDLPGPKLFLQRTPAADDGDRK
ncbi:MAG: hypothetical protein HY784_14055 [Chloroflexi bacterium]|nr:hypothetical protein [Chloroflexota bacterium]